MMKIPAKEIEMVSKLEPFERYKYAIKKVCGFGLLYTLKKEDEWALAEIEEGVLFSVWSAKEYAQLLIEGPWTEYAVTEIPLDDFLDKIVPLIRLNRWLVNVFSVNGHTGFVVDIDEFLRDLDIELDNYR